MQWGSAFMSAVSQLFQGMTVLQNAAKETGALLCLIMSGEFPVIKSKHSLPGGEAHDQGEVEQTACSPEEM